MNHKVPGDDKSLPYLKNNSNHPLPGRKFTDNAGITSSRHHWCSLACEHAELPRENVDGAKSCHTFNALWCNLLKEHVTRNSPCAVEHGQRRPTPTW